MDGSPKNHSPPLLSSSLPSHISYHKCPMYLSHQQVRRKHEDAILRSMKRHQRKLTTQPMALPSFNESWTSLKTQLLTELQRLARERQITLIEMREWILTPGAELTRMEQTWVAQTRKLISVMPSLPPPPKGLVTYPSTSTPLNQEVPNSPSMSTPSNTLHLPRPNDLIRQIFQTGRFPTPNFDSRSPRVAKHPSVATLMVPPSHHMKLEVVTEPPVTSSHRTSRQGSYGTKGSISSRSPSPTPMGSPNTLTLSI